MRIDTAATGQYMFIVEVVTVDLSDAVQRLDSFIDHIHADSIAGDDCDGVLAGIAAHVDPRWAGEVGA